MRELQVADFEWWVVLGSNQWHLPCERRLREAVGVHLCLHVLRAMTSYEERCLPANSRKPSTSTSATYPRLLWPQ